MTEKFDVQQFAAGHSDGTQSRLFRCGDQWAIAYYHYGQTPVYAECFPVFVSSRSSDVATHGICLRINMSPHQLKLFDVR